VNLLFGHYTVRGNFSNLGVLGFTNHNVRQFWTSLVKDNTEFTTNVVLVIFIEFQNGRSLVIAKRIVCYAIGVALY